MDPQDRVLCISGLFSTVGILGHVYIILCLILPRNGERYERVTRAINMTIGVSSFVHSLSCCFSFLWALVGMNRGTNPTPCSMTAYFLLCFIFSKVCVTSFLFILYWGRIVPLRNTVLIRLLEGFSQAIHWVIGVSVLVCFLLCSYTFNLNVIMSNSTDIMTKRVFYREMVTPDVVFLSIIVFLLIFLPLGLMTFSSLSVLLHLIRHLRRLRSETCEISSPQTEQQRRVMTMLFIQLLLYTCYLSILFTLFLMESQNWVTSHGIWAMVVPGMYSFCTAVNLIARNGFLRKRTAALLSRLRTCG